MSIHSLAIGCALLASLYQNYNRANEKRITFFWLYIEHLSNLSFYVQLVTHKCINFSLNHLIFKYHFIVRPLRVDFNNKLITTMYHCLGQPKRVPVSVLVFPHKCFNFPCNHSVFQYHFIARVYFNDN